MTCRPFLFAAAVMAVAGCSAGPSAPTQIEVTTPASAISSSAPGQVAEPALAPPDVGPVPTTRFTNPTETELCAAVTALYAEFGDATAPDGLEATITLVDRIVTRWADLRPLVPATATEAIDQLEIYITKLRAELDSGTPGPDIVERAIDAGAVGRIARDYCGISR